MFPLESSHLYYKHKATTMSVLRTNNFLCGVDILQNTNCAVY